jgi:hypothetical protein
MKPGQLPGQCKTVQAKAPCAANHSDGGLFAHTLSIGLFGMPVLIGRTVFSATRLLRRIPAPPALAWATVEGGLVNFIEGGDPRPVKVGLHLPQPWGRGGNRQIAKDVPGASS